MKLRYIDLIEQSFDFPQEEFHVKEDQLLFHGIPLLRLAEKYGTPLKFSYLPKISSNIQRIQKAFLTQIENSGYNGKYYYCYCTKSSHFSFVIKEALKNNIDLETSSAYDLAIIDKLFKEKQIDKDIQIICNGYKTEEYLDRIAGLINEGFQNVIPVLDNADELEPLLKRTKKKIKMGMRIASEEEPKFAFYTSRLGIGYKDIIPLYQQSIKENPQVQLEMLHFFINTGISDTAYYWNELTKSLRVYTQLKKNCPTLRALNIGGGFPIKNSLSFEYDYEYMISEIVSQIQSHCREEKVSEPDIYSEFGSYTVGESGGVLFKILNQKKQNDREKWNMIDGSFMTTLPDSWAISKKFIMLPLHRWLDKYERVFLGGLTCDSDDFYNSEQHANAIYLPEFKKDKNLYIGFFNTGAYQESLGGFGGIKHCLIPDPKHLIIDRNKSGELDYRLFRESTTTNNMLQLLGYD